MSSIKHRVLGWLYRCGRLIIPRLKRLELHLRQGKIPARRATP